MKAQAARREAATPGSSGRAVRLLINEIMNIQSRLADKGHPEARSLWHALERFATNPATESIIK